MSSFLPRIALPALCFCVFACSDDAGGENLPDGGFGTGDRTTDSPTTNPPTSNTTSGPTTTPTSEPTTDPTLELTTTDTDPSTTGMTDPSTTDITGETTTTGDETSDTNPPTTYPTTDDTTTDDTTTDDDTTGPPADCENDSIDDDEVCFVEGDTVATGAAPSDVVAGDFNGDGNLDVLVSSVDDNTVSVHLGDGAGGLGAAITTAVGANPTRLIAAEFSGDTSWDALTANTDDGTVSVLVADGVGGFTETAVTVGSQPVDLGIGDLDGANGLDFAVANAGDANFHTAVNDGSGAFTVLGPWAPAGAVVEVTGIALGQMVDAPVADAFYGGGDFYAATNGAGDGTMVFEQSLGGPAGTNLARFNIGDIDGNTDADVVATDGDHAQLYVGAGGVSTPGFQSGPLGTHVDISEAVIADVTGEGTTDIVMTDEGADAVIVHAGSGNVVFDVNGVSFAVGTAPSGLATADLNADGVEDLIVSNRGSNNITILLSNP